MKSENSDLIIWRRRRENTLKIILVFETTSAGSNALREEAHFLTVLILLAKIWPNYNPTGQGSETKQPWPGLYRTGYCKQTCAC